MWSTNSFSHSTDCTFHSVDFFAMLFSLMYSHLFIFPFVSYCSCYGDNCRFSSSLVVGSNTDRGYIHCTQIGSVVTFCKTVAPNHSQWNEVDCGYISCTLLRLSHLYLNPPSGSRPWTFPSPQGPSRCLFVTHPLLPSTPSPPNPWQPLISSSFLECRHWENITCYALCHPLRWLARFHSAECLDFRLCGHVNDVFLFIAE